MPKKKSKKTIGAVALSATTYLDMFDKVRVDCKHHAMNSLTKEHNCFEGNTKTECNVMVCPLKGKE